jgi:hypothetical protein
MVACLIGLLLTARVGAMYHTGRERAFWLGIVVFGTCIAVGRRLELVPNLTPTCSIWCEPWPSVASSKDSRPGIAAETTRVCGAG